MKEEMILNDMDLDQVSGGGLKYLIYTTATSYCAVGIKSDESIAALQSKFAGMSAEAVINSGTKKWVFTSGLSSLEMFKQKLTKSGTEFAMM